MPLNLIVIRSADPAITAAFYTHFGYDFDYHQHGSSPFHYSGEIAGVLLEIYPPKKSAKGADNTLRLGFEVPDLDLWIAEAKPQISSPPKVSPWGYRCIVLDPDGRKVEVVENS